jgi:hypothetical protein
VLWTLDTAREALVKAFFHHGLLSDAICVHILILENKACSMSLAKDMIY